MTSKSIHFFQKSGFLTNNNFQNAPKHKISCGISARQLSVLVLNCGSSSIKFKILDTESGEVTLDGQANNLNTNKVSFTFLSNKILKSSVKMYHKLKFV